MTTDLAPTWTDLRDAALARMGGDPLVTDYPCPQCDAALGEHCTSPRPDIARHGHRARQRPLLRILATRHANAAVWADREYTRLTRATPRSLADLIGPRPSALFVRCGTCGVPADTECRRDGGRFHADRVDAALRLEWQWRPAVSALIEAARDPRAAEYRTAVRRVERLCRAADRVGARTLWQMPPLDDARTLAAMLDETEVER